MTTLNATLITIIHCIKDFNHEARINLQTNLRDDLGMDSLDVIELSNIVADSFNIKLDDIEWENVYDIVRSVNTARGV